MMRRLMLAGLAAAMIASPSVARADGIFVLQPVEPPADIFATLRMLDRGYIFIPPSTCDIFFDPAYSGKSELFIRPAVEPGKRYKRLKVRHQSVCANWWREQARDYEKYVTKPIVEDAKIWVPDKVPK